MIVKTKLALVLSGSLHGLLLLHTELHVEPLQADTTQVLQPQYWIQHTGTRYHDTITMATVFFSITPLVWFLSVQFSSRTNTAANITALLSG